MRRKATDYDYVNVRFHPITGVGIYRATLYGTLTEEVVSEKLGEEIFDVMLLRQTVWIVEDEFRGRKDI